MTNSYLLFSLSEQLFGVQLVGAIEILPWRESRKVPLAHSYVEGLLEYRNTIYPVYSLAERLGIGKPGPIGFTAEEKKQAGEGKSIILLEEKKQHFGIVVDRVVKMTRLEEKPGAPEKGLGVDPGYVKSCVIDEDQKAWILDFERLFHAD